MKLSSIHKQESGATIVEYAVLVALIAVTALPSATYFGLEVAHKYCDNGVKVMESNDQYQAYGRYSTNHLSCEICKPAGFRTICIPVN